MADSRCLGVALKEPRSFRNPESGKRLPGCQGTGSH